MHFLHDFKLGVIYQVNILACLILLSLCLLVSTNHIGFNGVMLALVGCFYLYPKTSQLWWQRNKYVLAIVLGYLLLLVLFSFQYKQALHTAWGVIRGLCCSLLAAVLLRDVSAQMLQRAIYVVLIVCIFLLCIILVVNIDEYGFKEVLQRQGLDSTVNRNSLGVGIAVVTIFTCAVILASPLQKLQYCILGITILLLGFMAFVNHSRGAILAMIAAIVVMLLYWNWRKAVLIITGSSALFLWNESNAVSILTHTNSSFGNGREFLWPPVWERIKENPIWGYGLHALSNDSILQAQKIGQLPHVHSIYLDVLYSSGALGVFFWVWVGGCVVKNNILLIKGSNNQLLFYIGLGLLVYILVHGLVDFAFYSKVIMVYLSFSIMLVLALVVSRLCCTNSDKLRGGL